MLSSCDYVSFKLVKQFFIRLVSAIFDLEVIKIVVLRCKPASEKIKHDKKTGHAS